jgi:hypothetical protein
MLLLILLEIALLPVAVVLAVFVAGLLDAYCKVAR